MSENLTVVFSNGHDLDDYLFQKSIKWAELNPEDLVYWMRKSSMQRLPNLKIENLGSKLGALRRLKFLYNSENLTAACSNLALSNKPNIAAIIIQTTIHQKPSDFGVLLASLAHFTKQNNSKALVHVDTNGEGTMVDKWEVGSFVPEKMENEKKNCDNEEIEKKLRMISTIYSNDIYLFDGLTFLKK